MDSTNTLTLIKDSFESWYNKQHSENKISIAINYSDEQKLSIKAYHTINMQVNAIGIKNGESYTEQLVYLQENYNHGVITEQEAKDGLIIKLLEKLYGFAA